MKNCIYNNEISYTVFINEFLSSISSEHRKTSVNISKHINKIKDLSTASKGVSFNLRSILMHKKITKSKKVIIPDIKGSNENDVKHEVDTDEDKKEKNVDKSTESSSDDEYETEEYSEIELDKEVNEVDEKETESSSDDEYETEEYSDIELDKEVNEVDEKETEKDFWIKISNVKCYDKDEKKMSKSEFLRMLPKKHTIHEMNYYKNWMDSVFIPKLKEKIIHTNLMDVVSSNDLKDILAHIIFKGKDFYNTILQDPEVCLYLVNQYHPIYDWLVY